MKRLIRAFKMSAAPCISYRELGGPSVAPLIHEHVAALADEETRACGCFRRARAPRATSVLGNLPWFSSVASHREYSSSVARERTVEGMLAARCRAWAERVGEVTAARPYSVTC